MAIIYSVVSIRVGADGFSEEKVLNCASSA